MCFKVISNEKGKKGQNDPSLTSSKETNSTNSLSSGDQKGNNAAGTKNTQSEKANKPFTPFKPDISKDEKISSFKEVKVYYFDNQQTNSAKAVIEEPTIFQLESFRPKTQMIQKHNLITNNKTCTCTKTKCLKKYCECLANNQFCYNCNCVDCHNIPAYQSAKLNDDIEIITCTCTKSNCNKKYCECYKAGKKCNYNCRCLNCLNKSQGEVEQKKDTMVIERISVLINKGAILVDKQTLSTDFTAISQKRSRTLFHTDNINHKES